MKIQVKVGGKWRTAEATINALGHAVVKLPPPYEALIFKVWRRKRKKGAK